MTIRSNPPGAVVYIDDYEIGTTPVSTGFTYYGTRRIRLVKNGYETLTLLQPVPVPWYEIVPIDFVAENVVPGEIRDHHTFDYQLVPQRVVPIEQLLDRAEVLRGQTRSSGVVQAAPPGMAGPNPAISVPTGGLPTASPWPMASPGPAAAPQFPNPPGNFAPSVPGGLPAAGEAAPQTPYPTIPPGGWHVPGGA